MISFFLIIFRSFVCMCSSFSLPHFVFWLCVCLFFFFFSVFIFQLRFSIHIITSAIYTCLQFILASLLCMHGEEYVCVCVWPVFIEKIKIKGNSEFTNKKAEIKICKRRIFSLKTMWLFSKWKVCAVDGAVEVYFEYKFLCFIEILKIMMTKSIYDI